MSAEGLRPSNQPDAEYTTELPASFELAKPENGELVDQEYEATLERKAEELGLDPENPQHLGLLEQIIADAEAEKARETLETAIADAAKKGDTAAADTLQLYLRRIGEIPLLTASQEVELSKRIEAGDESAKTKMIESNLRLVVAVAKNFNNSSIPFIDLVQEGNTGLITAAEKFDWRMGYKFSTYATWWIRQAMTRSIANQANIIRQPVHVYEAKGKIRRIERILTQELGREPTNDEIAGMMYLTPERVAELKSIKDATSLDSPVSPGGDYLDPDTSILDKQADKNEPPVEEQVLALDLREQLNNLLSHLPEKERLVVEMRYGVGGKHQEHTLEAIGVQLGLTRERIRQIEYQALEKQDGLMI